MEPKFKSSISLLEYNGRNISVVNVVRYERMNGAKVGHAMHAMHTIIADVIIRVKQLSGSIRTPKVNIMPEGFNKPGCIDKLKARR